jgi:long-chain fatty acid transport protein
LKTLSVALFLLLSVATLHAQSSAEGNAGLAFNFGSPGARSLGLGGAFVAIADDATAAYTNPAGLTNIGRPELSLEGRVVTYTNIFAESGHGFGPASGIGFDDVDGIREGRLDDRRQGMSFASFVFPSDRWTLAIHRHELMNFRASTKTMGIFFDATFPGATETSRMLPSTARTDVTIDSYGGTVAVKLHDRISVGASLVRQQFNLRSSTVRYLSPFFGAPEYERPFVEHEELGHDTDIAFTVGALLRPSNRLRVGLVYQQGSEFDVEVVTRSSVVEGEERQNGKFHVPTVFRAGAAYELDAYTTVSVQADFIAYSRLVTGFVPIHGEKDHYAVDDGVELRIGVERMFANEWLVRATRFPVVIALGAWRDPDHRIRYTETADLQSLLFRRGEAEYHYSAGAGLSIGRRTAFNVAYDYSSRQRTFSLSGVTRF